MAVDLKPESRWPNSEMTKYLRILHFNRPQMVTIRISDFATLSLTFFHEPSLRTFSFTLS
jgi:hypothetical protein